MDIRYSRLGGLALLGLSGSAVALEFTVVLDNIGPQPLSPTFMATTNANWDNFTAGLAAPARIEQIAEDGPTSIAQMDAMAGQVAGDILDWLVFPGGPIMPGESRMATIEATLSHRWFQYASMLGMSNDAFIGSGLGVGDQQIDLFQNGVATSFDFTVSFLDAWDAGTEENTELAVHLGAFGNPGGRPGRERSHSGSSRWASGRWRDPDKLQLVWRGYRALSDHSGAGAGDSGWSDGRSSSAPAPTSKVRPLKAER